MLQSPVTITEPIPPKITARTVPNQCAVRPLSNSPNSFDAPRKSQLIADTRPRIAGGVPSCRIVCRMITDTLSLAPMISRANNDRGSDLDAPKTMVATPKMATAISIRRPAWCRIGRLAR